MNAHKDRSETQDLELDEFFTEYCGGATGQLLDGFAEVFREIVPPVYAAGKAGAGRAADAGDKSVRPHALPNAISLRAHHLGRRPKLHNEKTPPRPGPTRRTN